VPDNTIQGVLERNRMAAALTTWLDLSLGATGGLKQDERLRLFRDCRLAAAAVMLAVFPAIALAASEPMAVLAAMLLFGILPAAIALDVRRSGNLDRAVLMALAATGAVLLGGVLRGLPAASAMALLSVGCIEAFVVGGKAIRKSALVMTGMAAAAMIGLPLLRPEDLGHQMMPWATGTIAVALVVNVLMLARGMLMSVARERSAAREQRIQAREVETMVSETVIAADRSGAVIRISDNAERVLGLPAEALKARGLAEMVLVADRPQFLTALCDCALGGPHRTFRVRLRESAAGQAPRYRWVEVKASPSVTGDGSAMATLRDISLLVAEEERLAIVAAEAEAAKSARAAFLTTVNHELRTPLNSIVGFSEILANPAAPPASPERVREYAAIVNKAGQDLLRMVTSMIDITRIDSGVYDFEAEPADVKPLVESAVEAFRQESEAMNARFECHAPAEALEAAVDQRALRHILLQLLSNAAKFGGAAGPVAVRMATDGEWVTIAVTDRGPGIPKDKLEQLGRHFARADEGLSRERGGIGLGLSLASGLMALHGGMVGIESRPGNGTTITLSLPRCGATRIAASNIHALARPTPVSPPETTANALERRRA
jgi:two-component system, cell cycle sensor histidine kinase DivJ